MIKKVFYSLLIIVLTVPMVLFPLSVTAADNRTLQDLMNELNAMQAKLNSVENTKQLTNQQIASITQNISNISKELTDIENEVIQLGIDIEMLNEDITVKDAQIKKLVNFLEITNGESMYLEYAFGAKTLTDFIYRVSIVEQMTKYNKQLIDDMSNKIDEMKQRTTDLENKNVQLQNKKASLAVEKAKLGDKVYSLYEEEQDIQKDITDAKKVIENYKKMGCKATDKISECAMIPQDTAFSRPLEKGKFTGLYGWQKNPLGSGLRYHHAVDIGGNSTGTPVYATAAGTVVRVYNVPRPNVKGSSCGGNYVIIQHNINGVYYASKYQHLHSTNVKENEKVSKNDIIGTIGGGESYDWCTTGPHLHFQLAKGIYAQQFYSFSEPYSFNPASYIKVPNTTSSASKWTSRYQKLY